MAEVRDLFDLPCQLEDQKAIEMEWRIISSDGQDDPSSLKGQNKGEIIDFCPTCYSA